MTAKARPGVTGLMEGFCKKCGALIPECERCKKPISPCPHCGESSVRKRSAKHHRWFFSWLTQVFESWPDSHSFQPDDIDHLRSYLLCRSKHRDILGERLDPKTANIESHIKFIQELASIGQRKRWFAVEHNGCIVIVTPRSIDWSSLDEDEFRSVSSAVCDVIFAETGMAPDLS